MKNEKRNINQIAIDVRNQNYILFKKNITEQDEKILMLLGIEKVASGWTLSFLSSIFITSVRRSITNLKYAGYIKEVGTEISKTTGTKNTIYSLATTPDEEIDEWKRQREIQDEKDRKEQEEMNKLKFEALKKIAEGENKMISDYLKK